MKLSQVTLRAPSPTLKSPRVSDKTHRLEWKDSYVSAAPLNGEGPSLVFPHSNVVEAILAPQAPEKCLPAQEKPILLPVVPSKPAKSVKK